MMVIKKKYIYTYIFIHTYIYISKLKKDRFSAKLTTLGLVSVCYIHSRKV